MNASELYDILAKKVAECASLDECRVSDDLIGYRCFFDRRRTLALMDAVVANTRSGDVVADLGASTGVLGFAALECAKAMSVDLVERARRPFTFLHLAARNLGYLPLNDSTYVKEGKEVRIHLADARHFVPQDPLDVIVCEMIDTGLASEHAVPVFQNIRRYAKDGARLIPESAKLTFRLMDGWRSQALSPWVEYGRVAFATETRDGVSAVVPVELYEGRCPWEAHLGTRLVLPGGAELGKFDTLCRDTPAIVRAPFFHWYEAGDTLLFRVKYRFGSGQNIKLSYAGCLPRVSAASVPGCPGGPA